MTHEAGKAPVSPELMAQVTVTVATSSGPYVELLQPDGACRRFDVDRSVWDIGSAEDCAVALDVPGVQPHHLTLRAVGPQIVAESNRGAVVMLNGVAIGSQWLGQGDVLALGDARLVFHQPPGWAGFRTEQPLTAVRSVHASPPTIPIQASAHVSPGAQDTEPSLVINLPGGVLRVVLTRAGSTTIGTSVQSAVRLPEQPGVRPEHARIDWLDGKASIVDLGGGVTVNGTPVRTAPLDHGVRLAVGTIRMWFHDPAPLIATHVSLPETVSGGIQVTELGALTRIGRSEDNDIVLRHIQVSRRHAEVRKRGDDFLLVDEASLKGTYLNGVRISRPTRLKPGDHIRISDFVLLFDGRRIQHFSEEGNARIDACGLRRVVGKGQVILHDVSFSVYPREMVAVVGGSGSGKTTLLNALCGFRRADAGRVLVNGVDFCEHYEAFRSTLGFVPQEDIIHRELTVYRALYYAARLRLPQDMSRREIDDRIGEVLQDLHLEDRRDTVVAKLSGGQRKRVSIGVELLSRPRLFFLDEPTSGLDPQLEIDTMQILRRLADKGNTILVSTHATNSINLCDKVLFLTGSGYLAFYGSPAEARSWFGTDDFTDIYRKLQRERTPESWSQAFTASVHYEQNVTARAAELTGRMAAQKATGVVGQPPHPPRRSTLRQTAVITQRYVEILGRDPVNLLMLMGTSLVCALLIAFSFPPDLLRPFRLADYDIPGLTSGPRSLESLEQNYFYGHLLAFYLVLAPIFYGANNAIREIARERAIYRREHAVGLGVLPYVLSKVLALGMVCFFQAVILEAVLLVRFEFPTRDVGFVATLLLTLWLTSLAAMALGLAVSALMTNDNQAATALPALIIPQLLLTGSLPKLVGAAQWLTWLGLTRWGFTVLQKIMDTSAIFPTDEGVTDPMVRSLPQIDLLIQRGAELEASIAVNVSLYLAFLGAAFLFFTLTTGLVLLLKDRVPD